MIDRFDMWLIANGPVAVMLTEPLQAVQGPAGVVFPPTFAPFAKGDPPSYVIDETSDGRVALLDTVGSQANRLEPIFKEEPYSSLVPKATVKIGAREVNLLDAGHRAADALVRFSSKRQDFEDAFRDLADRGNSSRLAKLAPTSLVFGVWDSRSTGVKIPRLIGSTIRAYGVEPLTRAAQFFSSFEKEETEALGQTQDFLSEQGLSDAPAGRTLGGIIARKGILREALLNLVALRAISAGQPEETRKLQRYILGLSLVALASPWKSYLREGCLLVAAAGEKTTSVTVGRDGSRLAFDLTAEEAFKYSDATATAFAVGPAWEATFDSETVTNLAQAKAEKAAAKPKKSK